MRAATLFMFLEILFRETSAKPPNIVLILGQGLKNRLLMCFK